MPVERWTFVASGQAEVVKAYESIAAQAAKTEAKTNRSFKKQVAGAKRAAKETVNAEQRAQQKRMATLDRETQQRRQRIKRSQDREIRDLERKLAREAAAEKRALRSRVRAQERATKRIAASRRRTMGRVGGFLGGAAIRGIGVAGAAGALVLGAAARQSIRLRDRSIALAVKGGNPADASAIQRRLQNAAIATPGATAGGLAGGLERFVAKTGRLDIGQQFTQVMAEISVATGTSAEDIGGAMADLYEKFDISTVDEMSKAMATLAIQGKRGAFELEDAAKQFPKVAAAAQRFGLGGVSGLATLGGLTQIARQATPSGEEAATAVENMFKQLVSKADVIKRETKTDVFKDKGKTVTNDVADILVGTITGARGNLQQLQKIFDVRGIRAVSPLISEYNLAFRGQEGTEEQKLEAGTKALRAMIENAIDATGAEAEIKRDLAAMQEQTGAQLTAAWESLVAEVTGAATPAMGELAKSLSGFIRTADMGGLAAAFVALVEATGLAVEGLQAIGLLKEKKVDPFEEAKKRRGEAEAGLGALGLGAEQKKALGGIAQLEDVAAIGGGMDPADLSRRLADIGISQEQYTQYRKFTEQRGAAKDVLFAGDPTRQEALDKLTATGMDPKEAIARVSEVQDDPSAAFEPGNIDIPLIGRVGIGVGPTAGATEEQEKILQGFANTLDQARSKTALAAEENEKLAKAAAKAAEELGKFQDRTSPSIFGKLF